MKGLIQLRLPSGYLANCFWLMLPPLAISGLLGGLLPTTFQPEIFWHAIPIWIAWPETVSRIFLTGLPMLLPFSLAAPRQRWGLAIYGLGVVFYGLAWWPLIAAPESAWSTSVLGFAAPAYTPLLWIVGIGLVGMRSEPAMTRWASWLYAGVVAIFLLCHNAHTLLVYSQHMQG